MTTPRERFTFTVEAAHDRLGRTPVQRVKLLLKHAGRALGLRCIDVRAVELTNQLEPDHHDEATP